MKKRERKIAQQIIQLERECQEGKNISENMQKIQMIMHNLSLEQIFQIDDYITKNFDK